MSIKGDFEKRISPETGIPFYSFTLTNMSLLSGETIDCIISDASGTQNKCFRDLKIAARGEIVFNRDTCGWDWCNGDFFGILGRKDKLKDYWSLNIKQYAPGKCPDCHGTHKCKYCKGEGYSFSFESSVQKCPYCMGTGVCLTCYVPIRKTPYSSPMGPSSIPVGTGMASTSARRGRSAAQIQMDISNVQSQLNRVEWDLKMMELKGTNTSSFVLYNSQLQLRYTYQQRLAQLQQELVNAIS